MDHRRVAIFIDGDRAATSPRVNRLMGGPALSTGGDR